MTEQSPWAKVSPMRPNEAAVEVSFILIDATQGATFEEFSAKVVAVLNGVYLAGWQDSQEAVLTNLADVLTALNTQE